MTIKFCAASAAALLALCAPAQAGARISQLSESIILLGEPAPAAVTADEAVPEKTTYHRRGTDVLAAGERRVGGVTRAPTTAMPVAEDETTAAVDASSEGSESDAGSPLEDSELRLD